MDRPYKIELNVKLHEYDKVDYEKNFVTTYGNKRDYDFVTTIILTVCKILNVRVKTDPGQN